MMGNMVAKFDQNTLYSFALHHFHKAIFVFLQNDLDFWSLTLNINRVRPLVLRNTHVQIDQDTLKPFNCFGFKYKSIVTLTFDPENQQVLKMHKMVWFLHGLHNVKVWPTDKETDRTTEALLNLLRKSLHGDNKEGTMNFK